MALGKISAATQTAGLWLRQDLAPKNAIMRLQPFSILAKANFDTHLQIAKDALS